MRNIERVDLVKIMRIKVTFFFFFFFLIEVLNNWGIIERAMRIFKIIQRNRNTIINVYVTFLRAGRARGALSGKKNGSPKRVNNHFTHSVPPWSNIVECFSYIFYKSLCITTVKVFPTEIASLSRNFNECKWNWREIKL